MGDELKGHQDEEELPNDIPVAAEHLGGREAGVGLDLVPVDACKPGELHDDQGDRGGGEDGEDEKHAVAVEQEVGSQLRSGCGLARPPPPRSSCRAA